MHQCARVSSTCRRPHTVTLRSATTPHGCNKPHTNILYVQPTAGAVCAFTTGAVCSYCAQELDLEVIGLDDFSQGAGNVPFLSDIRILKGDLSNSTFLAAIFAKHSFDIIFHASEMSGGSISHHFPSRMYEENIVRSASTVLSPRCCPSSRAGIAHRSAARSLVTAPHWRTPVHVGSTAPACDCHTHALIVLPRHQLSTAFRQPGHLLACTVSSKQQAASIQQLLRAGGNFESSDSRSQVAHTALRVCLFHRRLRQRPGPLGGDLDDAAHRPLRHVPACCHALPPARVPSDLCTLAAPCAHVDHTHAP